MFAVRRWRREGRCSSFVDGDGDAEGLIVVVGKRGSDDETLTVDEDCCAASNCAGRADCSVIVSAGVSEEGRPRRW